MKKVLIASRNPVKINATKKAFEEVFTDRFEFEGVSADSLVSDQPMSNDETLKGATNRLQVAARGRGPVRRRACAAGKACDILPGGDRGGGADT